MMRGLLFSSRIIRVCIWGAKVELGVGEVAWHITHNGKPLNRHEQSQRATLWLLHASEGHGLRSPPCLNQRLENEERQLLGAQNFILS